MMRTAALVSALLALFAAGAFASDNPFLKPDKRKPEKPVLVAPVPVTMVNGVAVSAPVEAPEDKAVVGAKLIAVINGEEVWLKNEDKTYVRQKARDESKINLQEANQSAPEMPGLPVIEAGRPNTPKQ